MKNRIILSSACSVSTVLLLNTVIRLMSCHASEKLYNHGEATLVKSSAIQNNRLETKPIVMTYIVFTDAVIKIP